MGIFDLFQRKDKGPGIESMEVDQMGWKEVLSNKHIKVWQSEEFPAQLSLNFFPSAPDLPRPLSDVEKLRKFYRKKLARSEGAVLKVESLQIQGYRALETLFRIPQKKQPGFIYVGAFTLPFADRSYVVKVQEQEFTHIGEREKMIEQKMLEEKPQEVDQDGKPLGWEFDPYDPDLKTRYTMNLSEEMRFDLFFPDHPLSHVRQYMYRLKASLSLSDQLGELQALED